MIHSNIYNFFIPNDIKNLISSFIPINNQIKCSECNYSDVLNKHNFCLCKLCLHKLHKNFCYDCCKICQTCNLHYCNLHLDLHSVFYTFRNVCVFCNQQNMIRELEGKYTTYY